MLRGGLLEAGYKEVRARSLHVLSHVDCLPNLVKCAMCMIGFSAAAPPGGHFNPPAAGTIFDWWRARRAQLADTMNGKHVAYYRLRSQADWLRDVKFEACIATPSGGQLKPRLESLGRPTGAYHRHPKM